MTAPIQTATNRGFPQLALRRKPIKAVPHIPTYFSHSYRPEDQTLNAYLWEMFAEVGFAFAVDPESNGLSITQLEIMMRRSSCFVAVATHRPEQEYYKTSPFVVFEYGVAVQAKKPVLVLAETGVAPGSFDESHRLFFTRDRLMTRQWARECRSRVRQLEHGSGAFTRDPARGVDSVGMLLPSTGPYVDVYHDIEDLLERAGCEVVTIKPEWRNPTDLLRKLDHQDLVIVDVGADDTPPWTFPLLYGRFNPTLRLMHRNLMPQPGNPLPALMLGDTLERVAAADECAIWWSDPGELLTELERELARLKRERTQFRSFEEGVAYFHSLGRPSDGPVFISNAGADNLLARAVTRRLEMYNVRVFHYQFNNTIERGEDWRDRLLDKVRTTRLFVPLIRDDYWESPCCRAEYDLAIQLRECNRLAIYPYFLEDASHHGPEVAPQGTPLAGLSLDQQTDLIVAHVEDYLMKDVASTAPNRRRPPWSDEPEPRVDVAMITVLKEEYEAVVEELDWHSSAVGSKRHPNVHAWELGEIRSPKADDPYRVVLGMADRAGAGGGLLAVRHTIEAFRPRYVLLVGIAGGIGGVSLGDVVVSSRIYGYEYGMVDSGFRPRPDWIYPTDAAVIAAAQAMPSRHPGWSEDRTRRETSAVALRPPAIHVGPVASGNKVVDDLTDASFRPVLDLWPMLRAVEMEGLGAAEAIQDAREHGHSVNFAMSRGISDLPHRDQSKAPTRDDDGPSPGTRERDAWKVRASRAAATLAAQMIRLAWSRPPRSD